MILSNTQKIAHYGKNIALYDTSKKVLSYSTDEGETYQDITIPAASTTCYDMLVTASHAYIVISETYTVCYVVSLADGSYTKTASTQAYAGYLVSVFPHVIFAVTNRSTDVCSFTLFDYQTGAYLSHQSFNNSYFYPVKYAKKISETTYEIHTQKMDSDTSAYYYYIYKYTYNTATKTLTAVSYYKRTGSRGSNVSTYDALYNSYYYNYKIFAYNDYQNSKILYTLSFTKAVTQAAYFVTPNGKVIQALSYGAYAGFFLYEDGKLIDQLNDDVLISLSVNPDDYRYLYGLFKNATGYYIKKYEIFNGLDKRELALVEEVKSEGGEIDLKEDIDAVDFFMDFEGEPNPPKYIDLTHLYDGFSAIYLDEANKKVLASNTMGHSQKASSYIRFETKVPNTKINFDAFISSERYDYAAVHLTQSAAIPSYATATGRIVLLSGIASGFTTYETTIAKPGIYYLHFTYQKDSSTSGGLDKFCIDNIRLPIFKEAAGILPLTEKVVDGVICEATLNECVFIADAQLLNATETIYAKGLKDLFLKERIVDAVYTVPLPIKETIYEAESKPFALKETVTHQEARGFDLGETVDSLATVTAYPVKLSVYELALYKDHFFGKDNLGRFYDLADFNNPVLINDFNDLSMNQMQFFHDKLVFWGVNTATNLIEFCLYDMQQNEFVFTKTFDFTPFEYYDFEKMQISESTIYISCYKNDDNYGKNFGPSIEITNWQTDPKLTLGITGKIIALEDGYIYYGLLNGNKFNKIRKQLLADATVYTEHIIDRDSLKSWDAKIYIKEDKLYYIDYDYYCYDLQTGAQLWAVTESFSLYNSVFAYIRNQPMLLTYIDDGNQTTRLYKNNKVAETFVGTYKIYTGIFYENCIYACSSSVLTTGTYGTIMRYALVRDGKDGFSMQEFVLDPSGLALTERIIQDEKLYFNIAEKVESQSKELALVENIQMYHYYSKGLTDYTYVVPLPTHNKNLYMHEYINFKTGEWGVGTAATYLTETIDFKPFNDLAIKEEAVKMRDPIITEKTLEGALHYTVFNPRDYYVTGKYEKSDDSKPGGMGLICGPDSVFKSITSGYNFSEYYKVSFNINPAINATDRYIGFRIINGMVYTLIADLWEQEIPEIYRLTSTRPRRTMTKYDFIILDEDTNTKLQYSGIQGDIVYFKVEPTTTKVSFRPNYYVAAELLETKLYEADFFNDSLSLKEEVAAYSSGLSVKEVSKPNLVFNCDALKYIEKTASINYLETLVTVNYPLMKNRIVIFETSKVDVKDIARFTFSYHGNSGSVSQMLYPPDHYLIKQGEEEKFIYGFAVMVPYTAYDLIISRYLDSNSFAIYNIYQSSEMHKTLGANDFKMIDRITNYELDFVVKEEIFEEGTIFSGINYMTLYERVTAEPATKVGLSVKETAVGTFGNKTMPIREIIEDNPRPVYINFCLGSLKTNTVVPFPKDHIYNYVYKKISRDELLMVEIPDTFDPKKRTYVRVWIHEGVNSGYNTLDLTAGLVDANGNFVRFEYICPVGFYAKDIHFTADVTPYVDTYLKKNDLSSHGLRIGYLGVRTGGNFYRIFSDFAILQSQLEMGKVTTTETVLNNDNQVKTPYVIYTYKSGTLDVPYYMNDKIPLTGIEYLKIPIDEPVVPRRLILETSQPLRIVSSWALSGFTSEGYTQQFPYTLTKEGHYLYDITLTLTVPTPVPLVPKSPITHLIIYFEKAATEAVFYNIELYYSSIKQRDLFYMRENIVPFMPSKSLYMKEYVYPQPSISLGLKESVDRSISENRSIVGYEYVTTKDHVAASKLLGIKETVKHPTWSSGLFLQEVVPSDPVKDTLPIYEYVIEQQSILMPIKENIIVYKNGVDGKVMVEIVK